MILQCPSNEVLGKYAIGDLDDDASEDIERHLATCPACEDSVARFDSTEDSLMRHLPLAARQASAEVQDSPGWLTQLREGVVESQGVPAEAPGNITPDSPQAVFSAYELLGILGRGGMGIVYQARHRQLHRLVALKVLSPRFIATSEARRRFEREIRILGGLHHPGIVMATDANRIDGAAYLVMELIDGVDLARMVRDGIPLSVPEACEAGRQIADALAAAHQAETVHRDIKPSNVMVDRHGRIKLLDFGLAHLAELSTDSLETSLGRLLGTLDYMAPEQADSARPLDARVDLFGLGATLFFLLTGRPPHGDHSRSSLLRQLRAIAVDDPPRVRTLRADVPQDLDDFIARLLSRDPADRPASAESVATTLSTWAGGNLAARVAELRPNGAEIPGPDMGENAHRSLSQLLRTGVVAPDEEIAIAPPSKMRPRTSRQIPRRAAWVLGTIALVGAMLFGVTIFVTTPDGTLKIESEVESVRVDLLDDKDQTHPLEIHRGANKSTLRAGRYRVRLAGEHDGIAIDHDVITLKRGAQTVARITRTPATVNEPLAEHATAESTNPLYQGAPESEWQQIFARETSPTAKLDQAVALITLAAELPPKAQIQKILDVGAEIVHASFGEQVIDFALTNATGPPTQAPRWQIRKGETSVLVPSRVRFPAGGSRRRTFRQEVPAADPVVTREDIYSSYARFQSLLNHDVKNLPAEPLAAELSAALRQGAGPRAAFAASLLRQPAKAVIQANANASQVVLRELDVPFKGIDWSAVCLLVRALYSKDASADQVQKMAAGLTMLGATLRTDPAAPTSERMKAALMEAVNVEAKGGWPTAVRKTAADLMLERIVRDHRSFNAVAVLEGYSATGFTGGEWNVRLRNTYDPHYVAQVRAQLPRCFDQWLVVANGYLAQHAAPPFEPAVREIVESMGLALLLYSDGDNWPVDESVALLTRQLRAFYSDNSQNTIDQPVDALLPASPAMLLTQIVRGTGELPDFVKKGHLRSRPVAAMLNRFEIAIRAGDVSLIPPELSQMQPNAKDLIVEAPYEIIRLAVEPRPAKEPKVNSRFYNQFAPQQILAAVSRGQSMDPLLYLAVLTDLTGSSPAQDDRIAELVSHWTQGTDARLGLEHLLASRLKAREQARRLLQKMSANAKSPQLSNAMRELNATLLAAKP